MLQASPRSSTTRVTSSPQTFWERANCSKWGEYLGAIECEAIMTAHNKFPEPGRAVEFGCGGGRWSTMLAELGWDMTCIDIQEESISVCQERIPGATCICTDENANHIPCETGSAELLLLIEVPVMQSDWFLREASRVLTDRGLLVIVAWNMFSLRGFLMHMKAQKQGEFDWYSRTYHSWSRQLREEGFVSEYRKGFCWFPFGRFSNSPLIPVCTKIEGMLGLRNLTAISPWIIEIARHRS